MEKESGVTVVLGGQWGDEGKGKLVDILAQDADVVARCQVTFVSFTPLINTFFFFFQGGNNAGHTVKVGSMEYDFHLLPRYAVVSNVDYKCFECELFQWNH